MKRFFILMLAAVFPLFALTDPGPKKSLEPANPVNLRSDWWEYYSTGEDEMAQRIEKSRALFDSIEPQLSGQGREEARPLFEKFVAGLQTWAKLKEAPAPLPTYSPEFPDTYSYEKWVYLGKRSYEIQLELSELNSQYSLAQLSLKSNRRLLDTAFSAYLTTKNANVTARAIQGLEIMAAKVTVETEKLILENIQVKVEQQKALIDKYEEELNRASDKIDFSTITLQSIDSQLLAAQKRVNEVNAQIAEAFSAKVNSNGNNTLAAEETSLKFVRLNIDRIEASINLMNLKIQKKIVEWGQNATEKNHEIADQIEAWQTQLGQIKLELGDWKKESDLYLDKTLTDVSQSADTLYRQRLEQTENVLVEIQQIRENLYLSQFYINQMVMMKKTLPLTFTGFFVIAWDNITHFFTTHGKWFKQSLFKIGNIPLTPLGALKFLFIIFATLVIAKLIRRLIYKFGSKSHKFKRSSTYIFSRLIYYLILILGFIIAGSTLGFDVTAFAWIAGAITVWIGFSLQSIFHNFISGIIILITKTLRINDVIEMHNGRVGVVREITLRYTILRTFDGVEIIVPNSELVSNNYTNRTLQDYTRRLNIPFRISLTENKERIHKMVTEAAKNVTITLNSPEPEVWFLGYGDNNIKCELAVWVNETLMLNPNMTAESLYIRAIDDAFKAHNVEIPILNPSPTI